MQIVDEMNYFYYHMAMYELKIMNGDDYFKGLSYNSLLYINVIDQTPDCTVSRLAQILHITKSAVTLKINDLEKQGVIVKRRSETDKRISYLTLHPDVKKTLSVYDAVFTNIGKRLTEQYSQEQLDTFGEILHRISEFDWESV